MCGIAGVMSAYLSPGEIKTFKDLMVVSTLRGKWGSGVLAVPTNPKKPVDYIRSLDSGCEIVETKQFDELVKPKTAVLLGHCREPTRGGYTLNFMHPHKADHIVGVHNGTMDMVARVPVTEGKSDSKMVFEAIRDFGPQYFVENSKGAYALVWIDAKTDTINFLRNDQRPLYFAHIEGIEGTVYWASEASMLSFVLSRATVSTSKVIVRRLPPDLWITFRLKNSGRVTILDKKEVKPKVVPLRVAGPTTTVPPVQQTSATSTGATTTIKTVSPSEPSGLLITHMGSRVPLDEIKHILTVQGCTYCAKRKSLTDYVKNRVTWIDRGMFLCEECEPLGENGGPDPRFIAQTTASLQ